MHTAHMFELSHNSNNSHSSSGRWRWSDIVHSSIHVHNNSRAEYQHTHIETKSRKYWCARLSPLATSASMLCGLVVEYPPEKENIFNFSVSLRRCVADAHINSYSSHTNIVRLLSCEIDESKFALNDIQRHFYIDFWTICCCLFCSLPHSARTNLGELRLRVCEKCFGLIILFDLE